MPNSRNGRLLPLLVLSLSLVGCATSSPVPTVIRPVVIPAPPSELMAEPDLSESYSDSVQRLLLEWRQKLIDWRRSS